MVLGSDDSYPPYVFFDTMGLLSGITADYVALIERRLGITIEARELPGFNETLDAAKAGEIDIVPYVVASKQRPYLVFTDPCVRAIDRIILRSDDTADYTLADLGGRRPAAVDGYEVADFIEMSFPDIEVIRVESEVAGLRSLTTGDVEVLADLGVVSYAVAEEGISNLRVAGSVDSLFW